MAQGLTVPAPTGGVQVKSGGEDLSGFNIQSNTVKTVATGVPNPKRVYLRIMSIGTASSQRYSNGFELWKTADRAWTGRSFINTGGNNVAVTNRSNIVPLARALDGHLYGSGPTLFTVSISDMTVSAAGVISISWSPSTVIALDSYTVLEWEVLY